MAMAHTCMVEIRIDFAERDGVIYRVVVDIYSKWLEVTPVRVIIRKNI